MPESGGRLAGRLVLLVLLYQPWAVAAPRLNQLQRWQNQSVLIPFSFASESASICVQLCNFPQFDLKLPKSKKKLFRFQDYKVGIVGSSNEGSI